MKKLFPFLMILLCFACEQEPVEPVELGYEYMPLEEGRFWVYGVNETVVYGEDDIESSYFFYQDHISHSYLNQEGRLVYTVSRSKSSDQLSWESHSTYTLQIKNNALIRLQDNLNKIPLVFPVASASLWDGNAYNVFPIDDYQMQTPGPFTIEGNTYNNAVKIIQQEEDDLITIRDNRFEVYAFGVGMIEQYIETLTYCSRNDCLGEQIIESGRLSHLELITHGKYQ
ncbi:hypothetical protein [Echinicola pacifica]|nr:hypothetical protein [Echinicola pacifica]